MSIAANEAELSVIGAICIEPKLIEELSAVVDPDDFQARACSYLFDAAIETASRGKAFDPIVAADMLEGHVDDPYGFIRECIEITPTIANAEIYARLIHKRAQDRRLKRALLSEISAPENDDLAANVAGICQEFLKNKRSRGASMQDIMLNLYTSLDAPESENNRIDTGFPKLDRILKGLWPGNLILIGARPGVGKSCFASQIAVNSAKGGRPVHIYSLEMQSDELGERLLANYASVPLDNFIDRNMENKSLRAVTNACSFLSGLPITIFDGSAVTVSTIRANFRAAPGTRLIIVDYIALMGSTKKYENRNLELGAISRDLKNLASELGIPIVCLAQLNRGRDDTEEPSLRDLRDSGELEQNANKVIFLWNVDRSDGIVGVSVAKNRRGRTGRVEVKFFGEFMRMVEMESEPPAPKKQRSIFRTEDD